MVPGGGIACCFYCNKLRGGGAFFFHHVYWIFSDLCPTFPKGIKAGNIKSSWRRIAPAPGHGSGDPYQWSQ
jgi:hypothetical protein